MQELAQGPARPSMRSYCASTAPLRSYERSHNLLLRRRRMAGSRFAHPVKASAPGRANGGEAPISVPGASRATGQEGAGGGSWRRGNEPSPSPTGWRDVEAAPGGGGIEGHRGGRRWRGLRKAERKEEALPPMGSWSLSAGRRRVAEEMERGREGRGVSESPSVFECDYRPTCQRANSFPSNLTS
jgi:hypothetical protein